MGSGMNCRQHLNNPVICDRAECRYLLSELIVPRRNGMYSIRFRADQKVSALVEPQWIVCPPGKRMRHRHIVRFSLVRNDYSLPLAARAYGGSQQ
jgi:hypothetical protein